MNPRRHYDPKYIGQRFGRLVIISRSNEGTHGYTHVLCKCDCGNERVAKFSYLLRAQLKSCGCLKRGRKPLTAFEVPCEISN